MRCGRYAPASRGFARGRPGTCPACCNDRGRGAEAWESKLAAGTGGGAIFRAVSLPSPELYSACFNVIQICARRPERILKGVFMRLLRAAIINFDELGDRELADAVRCVLTLVQRDSGGVPPTTVGPS